MYQAKCGDMTMGKWRQSRHELEDMFLLPLSDFQIGTTPVEREGILVSNGHASPYVEPVMEHWFEEQKRIHARDIRFMHLDGLVDWILRRRLTNELKAVFGELGIPL